MISFKKITGNYPQVVDLLELPKALYQEQTQTQYLHDVENSFSTIRYLSFCLKAADLKTRLDQTEHLSTYSYYPGNFDASVFQLPAIHDIEQRLSIAYIDDADKLCGLTITVPMQHPDEIEDRAVLRYEENRLLFTISVIKNTNGELAEREVTVFSPVNLLPAPLQTVGNLLKPDMLFAELSPLLNSQKLTELLRSVFIQGSLSFSAFNQLQSRFLASHNIDHRDYKKELFEELISIVMQVIPQTSVTSFLQTNIAVLRKRSESETNFFTSGQFEAILETLVKEAKDHIFVNREKLINKDRMIYEMELTLQAICLNLQAIIQVGEEKEHCARELIKQAEQFRQIRDEQKSGVGLSVNELISRFGMQLNCQLVIRKLLKTVNQLKPRQQDVTSRNFFTQKNALFQLGLHCLETAEKQTNDDLQGLHDLFETLDSLLLDSNNTTTIMKLAMCTEKIKNQPVKSEIEHILLESEIEKYNEILRALYSQIQGLIASQNQATNSSYQQLIKSLLENIGLMYQNKPNCLDFVGMNALESVLHHAGLALANSFNRLSIEQLSHNLELVDNEYYLKLVNQLRHVLEYKRYTANLLRFDSELVPVVDLNNGSKNREKLQEQGNKVLTEVRKIATHDPCKLSEKLLAELSDVLESCYESLKSPNDKAKVAKLVELSQTVSGKESTHWKMLGASLLLFAGLALIVAGVLAAIPTGGSSLLLVVANATGINLVVGGATIGLAAATGFLFFKSNSANGLARSISEFQHAVAALPDESSTPTTSSGSVTP